MHQDSITASVLDALILACNEAVRRLARRYGSYGVVEPDDLYIVAMIEICKAAPHVYQYAADPIAYLCAVARYAMLDELRQECTHLVSSLDAPITDDGSLCLADLVPAPVVAPAVEPAAAGVMRDALVRLSARQQEVLRSLYGFEGCGCGGTHREIGSALGISQGAVGYHATRGRQALRQDVELCKVLDVEVER